MVTVTINIRKEIIIWLVIFCLCNLLNVCSILVYKTQWSEIYTQLGIVGALSFVVYFFIILIRSGVYLVKLRRKKDMNPR
jgi:hypothetical protein